MFSFARLKVFEAMNIQVAAFTLKMDAAWPSETLVS
jgi:hypothetical protein